MKLALRAIRGQAGFTLVEMVIVIAVLAVAASIAIPKADPQAAFGADAVASEIASAVRFAQREATRTGAYHQISVDPAAQSLKVYRPTSNGEVLAIHPVDKRAYQINFANNAMSGATIVSSVFRYEDGAVTSHTTFGPDGVPVDPASGTAWTQFVGALLGVKDVSPLKEDGKITVRYGRVERVVRIAPLTGRVTF